tara:strand:+ start:1595 stop:1852 length:258 start_codon:yes stop_codon:yes gene_type:complete
MKTYICKTTTAIRVEAEDETEAEELASLEMDIGDIDWEAEEVNEQSDALKELSISIACLLDEPSDISISDIEHLQNLVTKLENTL